MGLRLTFLALLLPSLVLAQSATRPAPHRVLIPPGHVLVEAAGRKIIAMPGDEAWVRRAITALAPATRPTTAPSDILDRLAAVRPELTRRMVADLALSDPKKLDPWFEKTAADIQRFRDLKAPLYYLATTRKTLLNLVKSGQWVDPRYHYNRVADEVMVDTGLRLSVENPMDDMVIPSLFQDDASPEVRAGQLQRTVQYTEHLIADETSYLAQSALQVAFIRFSTEEVFRPMNLTPGRDWVAIGLPAVLAAGYTQEVTGMSREYILRVLTAENPRTPVHAANVDLLHPADVSALRDEIAPFYFDAVRRKATAACAYLVDHARPGSVAGLIEALREKVPPSPEGVVGLVKERTGVDVGPMVGAVRR